MGPRPNSPAPVTVIHADRGRDCQLDQVCPDSDRFCRVLEPVAADINRTVGLWAPSGVGLGLRCPQNELSVSYGPVMIRASSGPRCRLTARPSAPTQGA